MSKKMKPKVTIAETVMDKVKTGQITMKPKWYFVLGSTFMGLGVLGMSIGAIFLFTGGVCQGSPGGSAKPVSRT